MGNATALATLTVLLWDLEDCVGTGCEEVPFGVIVPVGLDCVRLDFTEVSRLGIDAVGVAVTVAGATGATVMTLPGSGQEENPK